DSKLPSNQSLVYSPNGQFLIVGGGGLRPEMWSVPARSSLPEYFQNRNGCGEMVLSPDGKFVATSHDNALYVWDAKTGKALGECDGHERQVDAESFAPDGKSLVSVAGEMGRVRRWNSLTGEALPTWTTIKDLAYAIAYSPDGKTVAVGTGNHD